MSYAMEYRERTINANQFHYRLDCSVFSQAPANMSDANMLHSREQALALIRQTCNKEAKNYYQHMHVNFYELLSLSALVLPKQHALWTCTRLHALNLRFEYNLHKNVPSSNAHTLSVSLSVVVCVCVSVATQQPDIYSSHSQNMHIFIGICITMSETRANDFFPISRQLMRDSTLFHVHQLERMLLLQWEMEVKREVRVAAQSLSTNVILFAILFSTVSFRCTGKLLVNCNADIMTQINWNEREKQQSHTHRIETRIDSELVLFRFRKLVGWFAHSAIKCMAK